LQAKVIGRSWIAIPPFALVGFVVACGESGQPRGGDAPRAGTGNDVAGAGGSEAGAGGTAGSASGASGGTAGASGGTTGGLGGMTSGGGGGTAPMMGGSGPAGGASGAGGAEGGATSAGASGSGSLDPERWMDACVPKGPALLDVPGVERLALEQDARLRVLELAGGYVYYGDTRLKRIALDSREIETVVAAGMQSIAVGADAVYGVYNSSLYAASLATLPAEQQLILEGVRSEGLLVDDTHVYFQRSSPYAYVRLAFENVVPGAEPETVVADLFAAVPRIREGMLYFTNEDQLHRVPVSGGVPETVGARGPHAVDTDGDTLFFTLDERLYRKPMISPLNGTEWTPLAAGNRLLEGSDNRERLAPIELVGDRVYYREASGALAWVKTDASDCRIVAQPEYVVSETLDFAVDETFVYLVHDRNALYAVPHTE
jgi:hypothetical protein